MPYLINDEPFSTKADVEARCREILARTVDGEVVQEVDADFLYGLFQHHDEWAEKSGDGVAAISTQTTLHGTRCFVLRAHCGKPVDISFRHASRKMPSSRSATQLPQELRDFRDAARTAIREQVRTFRDQALRAATTCPITGEPLTRDNTAIDHLAPLSFDQLAFDFCIAHQVNPLAVVVGSVQGVVATFEDTALSRQWQEFHQRTARLRLISKTGNLRLPKVQIRWEILYS